METISVYSFDELEESVKETVLDKHRYTNVDYDWQEFVIDDIKAVLSLIGFDVEKVYFELYSQGFGACFDKTSYRYAVGGLSKLKDYAPQDSELIEIATRLQALQRKHFYKLRADITHKGRYYHEQSMYYDNDVNDDLIEIIEDICHYMYKRIRNEYDCLTSDEAIIESLNLNEFKFTEDGITI